MIKQIINRFFQYTDIDTDINARDNTLCMFVGGVLGYCLFAYVVFGYVLFTGEPYSESSNLYFYNADGRISQFLVKDFGYFVLPQQIIAYVGYILAVPSRYIPYFYSGAATLITGMMIFVFCLPRFRSLIPNDIFRLMLCIAVACIATAKVREFVNFTYYSAFFVMIICAMVMVAKPDKLPWYVKTLPIFLLAKPAILAVFPILVISLFYTKNNFRWILGLCFIAVIIQLVNGYLGDPPVVDYFPIEENLYTPLSERFMVFIDQSKVHINALWQVQFTPILPAFAKYMLTIGTIASLLYVCFTWKHPAKLLIIFGLIIIMGADFVVSFGLKLDGLFNIWKNRAEPVTVFRWTAIQIIGIVTVAGAVCLYFSEKIGKHQYWYGRAIPLFIVWLVASGWGYKLYETNKWPWVEPQIIAWQQNHDEGVFDKVCTSIRPRGWVYDPGMRCSSFRKDIINPLHTQVPAETQIALFKPEGTNNRMVQSIIVLYHVPANHPNYLLTLEVNEHIFTKIIARTSRAAKNMHVQFNLPTPINGEDIYKVLLKPSTVIYMSTDKATPDKADSYWFVK